MSTDVSVTLASIGDQAFADTTIAIARAVGVLAWLLPVLAVVCFAGGDRPLPIPVADGGAPWDAR